MKNGFAGLSKCVCKSPLLSSSIQGVCSACFGRIPEDKSYRAQTPTLNPFYETDSGVDSVQYNSPNPLNHLAKIAQSTSNAALYQNIHHKRSNTSKKSEARLMPKNLMAYKQIHNYSDSHPTMVSIFNANKPLTARHPSQEFSEISSSLDLRIVGNKKHDRALSSRVHKLSFSPLYSDFSAGLPSERENFIINECPHKGHANSVNCISFIQNKAFSGSSDYKIISWPRLGNKYQARCQSITPLATYKSHSHKVHALEAFPNSILISAGQESRIRIWQVSKDFKSTSFFPSGEKSTKSLLSLPDNKLASGSASGAIKIWDVQHKSLLKVYTEHHSSILSLAPLSNFTFLAGSQDGTAKLFDLRTSRPLSLYIHLSPVTSLLVWNDQSFYSASEQLWKWDFRSTNTVQKTDEKIQCLGRLQNNLVTGGKSLKIWENDLEVFSYTKLTNIMCVKFNPTSEILYVGCRDSTFQGLFIN